MAYVIVVDGREGFEEAHQLILERRRKGEADAVALQDRADLEAMDGKTGHAEISRLIEAAGQQPARIVVGVLKVERPGEVDVAIERLEILMRQVRTAELHVR